MEKLEGENLMKTCYFCRGPIQIRKIEHVHHWKGQIYLFKNVKAEVCSQCGETFLLPESLKYMDQTIQHPDRREAEIKVPVFSIPEFLSA